MNEKPAKTRDENQTLRYEFDPTWPQELPDKWVLGQIPGVAVDSDDNVIVVNRQDITEEEAETSENAPPVIVFNAQGEVIKTWGDANVLPIKPERILIDFEHNVWITGQLDGMIQKYSWEGELLMQIGKRGRFDSSDGTIKGVPLNSARDLFFQPTGVATDPENGDIYVSDGYGNKRVVVFDSEGRYLRQWGRQATPEEAEAGVGGVFADVVHAVDISQQGLVCVCDRQGDRIQVFDKMGNFQRNIWVRTGTATLPDPRGTAWTLAFSPDAEQRLIYVMNGRNEQVHIVDYASGEILSTFGRPGHQPGAFTHGHTIAVDSMSRVYISETHTGRRVQRFSPART